MSNGKMERMNDQDKALARWALERKRLSIEQVEEIRAEADRTGRRFREIAVARGLLSAGDFRAAAPIRIPPLYLALLSGSLLIFAGLLTATLFKMRERTHRDEELALETERSNAEADRKGFEAGHGYQRSVVNAKEAAAKEHLARARAAMARVDRMSPTGGFPTELGLALNEAFVGYNMYLAQNPDDAAVRIERARTHELRRNYDLAISDLEAAAKLRPELEPAVRDRIAQLRLLLPRKTP